MSLAEELYNQLPEKSVAESETPPLWLDILFLITVTMIHIIYASKFTNFSLSYLKAKCEEKKDRKKWSESKLYLEAVLSHRTKRYVNININDIDEENEEIYTKLWMQLSLIRNLLKLLLFICCCIVLILYISFLLNILFEFLITCFVNYQNGSFLALIILPFLVFVNIGIIRFIIFGIMASWSINVDNIADNIAYQQYHLSLKKYAHKDDDENDDDYDTDNDDDDDDEINTSPTSQERTLTFKQSLKGFSSEYFIAVHWRLLIVISSVMATILALPTFSSDIQQTRDKLTDTFWCQLFLRYMILAMASWLFLYFCLIIAAAIYGRLTTLTVFNEILNDNDDNDDNNKMKNAFLRLFCLMDAFAIKDQNMCWKQYKIVVFTLFFVSGLLCIIIGSAMDNGLVRFVGVINMLYYIASLLLTMKIRGIHYLWRSDMISLELKNWWETDEDDDDGNEDDEKTDKKKKGHHRYHSSESHAAGMTFLRHNHLQKLLSHNMSISDIDEDEEKSSVLITADDDKDDDEDEDKEENDDDLQTEEDVITLYISTCIRIYNERRNLYEDRIKLIWYKNFREIQKINYKILCNYLYSTFKLYKMYWLLILPYNYSIRPLSVICSGKSISEQLIKYKYDKYTYSEIGVKGFKFVWHGIKGIVCCGLIGLIFIGLLYLSVALNDAINDNLETNILIESINNNTLNISIDNIGLYEKWDNYPICQLKWDANLSVFDLSSLGHVAYEIGENPNDQIMSMQQLMCLYFDRISPQNLNDSSLCSWQIIYISRSLPAFMHIRHNKNNTDLIAIRGTWTTMDMLQDIALFNEVALLQTASWIIPITTILPQSFIIRIVYFASWFEGRIDNKIRARFDESVFKYCYNYLLNTNNRINSLYFIGHSLGGGIAQIVAAELYHINKHNHFIDLNGNDKYKNLEIKSFSMAAPGLTWNSRKFSFDVDDLYQTATLLRPRHDIVSSIDKYGGLTQNIKCDQQAVFECHLTVNTICELSKVCNVYNSHNPNLIQSFCQYTEIKGDLYMEYANYSS